MPGKATTLSNLIEIDSEDDFARADDEVMLTPDSAVENKASKARRKPAASSRAASKVTKPKATTKKATATAAARLKRSALLERKNVGNVSDTEIVEEDEEHVRRAREEEEELEMVKAARRAKTMKAKAETSSKTRKTIKSARSAAQVSDAEEDVRAKMELSRTKGSRAHKRAPSAEPRRTIPETQPEVTEVTEPSALEAEEAAEPTPKPIRRSTAPRARSLSRQRQPFRRAGSASDTERTGDPVLRRKLGDITRQLENMQLKYNNLREVGMRDADSNFERLRKTTEQRAKAQDEIIASLKKELALQKSLAAETKTLRAQVASLTSENARLASERTALTQSVQEAHTESKSLSAKLAAARASSAPADSKQPPGSAVKRHDIQKASSSATTEVAMLKLKEELYGDLTGLILNGVKKLDGEDIYDCIQTGRNGTLHFHLSISSASSKSAADYSDAEFAYTPLLDEKNDRDLIDILPDYLTEEICFPRSSASKFYAKVVDCMTKKVLIEE